MHTATARQGINFPLPMDDERVVPQYGPEWVEHVTSGGAVRNGNILLIGGTGTKRPSLA